MHNQRDQPPPPVQLAPLPTRALILWISLLCLVWGSTWVVIADGLDSLPPLTSAAARFVLAALAMSGVVALMARREGGEAPPWWLAFSLGTLNFAASYAIARQVCRYPTRPTRARPLLTFAKPTAGPPRALPPPLCLLLPSYDTVDGDSACARGIINCYDNQ